jgi:hypothetical protein
VLSETAPSNFRATLLGETLRLVRRRRRWRQTRRVAGIFAVAGLLAVLIWQNLPEQSVVSRPLAKKAVETSYKLIHTQPLSENAVVTTRQFSASQFVASISTVVQVVTTNSGFHQINDDELLALVSGRPAVLIRTGPHSEELVFANPEDQKDFLKN